VKIQYHANARIPSLTANSLQIMKMCAAFARLGHDTSLVVPRFDRTLPTRDELERQYGVSTAFAIRWLRGWRMLGRRMYEARALLHARRSPADLYFTRNERLAARLARRRRPVVLEIHQPPRKARDVRALRRLARTGSLRALVVISDALRRLLLEQFPDLGNTRILVEHDGVDIERFRAHTSTHAARERLGWSRDPLTVGYAGHLYAGRGIELIMELAARFPHACFRIMGGEPVAIERTRTELRTRNLRNVELLGFIPNADLPQYLFACDVLLMPYARSVAVSGGGETAAFASPLKMFEYMAAQRPIIASRLPGVMEVLSEDNALLCDPEDVEGWSGALEAAHDAALRKRLAERAERDVQHYAWDRRAQRIVAAALH
jgi:glycosyltransferase involved in cell wall biosynthesis